MTETNKRPVRATKPAAAKAPKATPTTAAAPAPAPKTAPAKSKVVKLAKETKVAPVVPEIKDLKVEKHKKKKMVRDSFTMPESDYANIAALKARCLKAGISAKKSEVLRAALNCLAKLSDTELTKAISNLEVIKTGRPSKG